MVAPLLFSVEELTRVASSLRRNGFLMIGMMCVESVVVVVVVVVRVVLVGFKTVSIR